MDKEGFKMSNKTFQFTGKPGEYFVVALISGICSIIPILGWPLAFNTMVGWVANGLLVDGRKIKYSADYGEVLVFLLLNFLLILVTLGIYTFWYVPKQLRFIADHTTYVS